MRHLLVVALSMIALPAKADDWLHYANPRFGVSCDYPALFSRRDPPPDNGDGQAFRTADGSATLRVFGFYNVDNATAAAMLAERQSQGGRIAYKMSRVDRFAFSGVRGTTEVYTRCNLGSGEVVGCVEISYPVGGTMQAAVTRISQSLRVK